MRSRFWMGAATMLLMLAIAPLMLAAQFERAADDVESLNLTTTPSPTGPPPPAPTLDPFPRPSGLEIIVAEQVFERGRMFYIQPVDRIWVLYEGRNPETGPWEVYMDTWEEGDMEFDESIEAPDGLVQPIRGFGKLWRENETIRQRLGWGLDPELGHMTTYLFVPGDEIQTDRGIAIEPGYHGLGSIYGRRILFNETAGTWCFNEGVDSLCFDPED